MATRIWVRKCIEDLNKGRPLMRLGNCVKQCTTEKQMCTDVKAQMPRGPSDGDLPIAGAKHQQY